MGLGDNLIASGMARGAYSRGKKIAFGDGRTIIWDQHSETVFRHNPNIAAPGSEGSNNLEWIKFYKGHRQYNQHDPVRSKWIWNYAFKITPGEMFFTDVEKYSALNHGRGFVLVEPGVPQQKSVAPNKQWSRSRYRVLASMLQKSGIKIRQFVYPGSSPLPDVPTIRTAGFRQALAILKNASAYVGPEGGLHHGAAAVGVKAVVLFGGFIPPEVTGYATHVNLTGGAKACGSLRKCDHCAAAMNSIRVEEVYEATVRLVKEE